MHILTAFSGKLTDENGQEHNEANIKPPEVRDVETSFKDAHGPYRVLIVADKFQTGFDERRLCAMYVDKKLSGVATVQTLWRLNRICDGKTDPIVLDFVKDPAKVLEDFQLYYKSDSLPDNVDPSILFEVADDLDAAGIYTEADMDAVAEIYFKTKDTTGHENFRDRLKHPIERWNDQINAARRAKPQDNETIQRLLDFRAKLRTYVKSWEFLSQIVNFEDPSMVKRAVVAKYLYRNLHVDENDDEIVDIAGVDVIGARVEAATDPMNLGLTDGDGELAGLEVPTFGGGGAAKPGSETLAAFDEAVDEANQILEAAGIPTNTPVMRSFVLNLYEMLQQEESLQEMARENTREQLEQAPALSDELSSALFTLMTANEQLGELFTGDMVSIDKLRKVMATLLFRAANDNAQ